MLRSIDWCRGGLAVAVVLASLTVVPALAQTQTPSETSPPSAPQSAPPAEAAPPADTTDRVEARIQELHDKLAITPKQEAAWGRVARVMRDNARIMDGQLSRRGRLLATMSAVDDLRSYRDLTRAHAKALERLVAAFERLYRTMPRDQRKNADVVFAQFQQPPAQ